MKMMIMMIFTLLDRKPLIDSSAGSGLRLSAVTGEAEFREVTFKYPNRKTFVVLDNLDLSIRQVTMMRMITIMMIMILMIIMMMMMMMMIMTGREDSTGGRLRMRQVHNSATYSEARMIKLED